MDAFHIDLGDQQRHNGIENARHGYLLGHPKALLRADPINVTVRFFRRPSTDFALFLLGELFFLHRLQGFRGEQYLLDVLDIILNAERMDGPGQRSDMDQTSGILFRDRFPIGGFQKSRFDAGYLLRLRQLIVLDDPAQFFQSAFSGKFGFIVMTDFQFRFLYDVLQFSRPHHGWEQHQNDDSMEQSHFVLLGLFLVTITHYL